jgi:type I restriction enzyme, S subunit
MSLPMYPAYRDSEVEWLGPIPAHWETERLKRRCHVFPSNVDKKSVEGETTVRLCNYTDVYYNDSISADMPFMEATASEEQVSKFTLRAGDTVFTKDSETADDIGISAFVPLDIPGVVCGYHLSIARPLPGVSGAYVKRLFDAHYTKARFAVLANGLTRVGLNQYAVDNVELPWPPQDEQTAIIDFLDREIGKIDTLIAEQEKLLALLAEKRQATISHAVTRGLDPNVPMKESGISWLGEVPAHWGVRSISSLSTKITNGYVGPTRDVLVDEGIRYLQSLHIKGNTIRFDQPYYVRQEWSDDHAKSILEAGDVLIVQTGDIGQSAVVTEEFAGCNCHALIIVAPVREELDGRWLSWVLNSDYGFNSLLSIQTGALHPHLNCGNVKGIYVPLPPMAEQRQIIEHIQEVTGRYQDLTEAAEKAVELLRERRSALIAAAVTGKIDVRSAVPNEAVAA